MPSELNGSLTAQAGSQSPAAGGLLRRPAALAGVAASSSAAASSSSRPEANSLQLQLGVQRALQRLGALPPAGLASLS